MAKLKIRGYEWWVYSAYLFFWLVGLGWLVLTFFFGRVISAEAIIAVIAFSIQAWWRNRLANLILGILTLIVSIFVTLEFLALGFKVGYSSFGLTMLSFSVAGLIFSGILIFSYTKLSFRE